MLNECIKESLRGGGKQRYTARKNKWVQGGYLFGNIQTLGTQSSRAGLGFPDGRRKDRLVGKKEPLASGKRRPLNLLLSIVVSLHMP